MKIYQTGNKITGDFKDLKNGTDGKIQGEIKGNKIEFIRNWGNASQYFTLFVSDDRKVLEGTLKGARDESVGVEFKAIRQE